MTKGKPWSVEEVKKLRELVEAKAYLHVTAEALGKPFQALRMKILHLDWKKKNSVTQNAVFLLLV